jgi:hypothetical protein
MRRTKTFSKKSTASAQSSSTPSPVVPPVGRDPREAAVDPHAEAAREAAGVVLLADVRVVDVADLVLRVEVDEEAAVADGNVSGHRR